MLYLTCTMISSVDLAHYGVSRAEDWVSVDCGTKHGGRCLYLEVAHYSPYLVDYKWCSSLE